jgi:uncharacterized protein YceK
MKKLMILIMVLAMALSGCATVKGWFCSNEATINNIIAGANNTITTIESMFPGMIPVEYQAIIDVARAVVTQGETYLAAGCPTDAQVSTLQSQQTQVTSNLKAAGVATMKALKK